MRMKSCWVSIIIPVFNVKDYVNQCLLKMAGDYFDNMISSK